MAEDHLGFDGVGLAGSVPLWQVLLEGSIDPGQPARFEEAVEAGAPDFAVERARHTRRQNEAEAERKRAVEDAWFVPDTAQGAAASASITMPAPGAVEAEATSVITSSCVADGAKARAGQADASAKAGVGASSLLSAAVASPPTTKKISPEAQPSDAKQEDSKQEEPRGPQSPAWFWVRPGSVKAEVKAAEEVIPVYRAVGPVVRWDQVRAPDGVTELEGLTYVPGVVGDVIDWIVGGAPYPNRAMALATAVAVVGTKVGRRLMGDWIWKGSSACVRSGAVEGGGFGRFGRSG
jgi:hypothetical protein